MNKKSFWKSGHKPTLFGSFLYFDISFMIWGMIGPLAVVIANDYPMDPVQKANLVALPILGGSLLRLVLGFMSDYIGPKLTGQIGMLVTIIPLLLGWLWVDSLEQLYVVALLLGVAGASFAAALPLAGQWYPKEHQGLAMGIAGAGNSGTVLATLFANRIAQHFGSWEAVFGLAILPILTVFILFSIFARNSPHRPAPKSLSQYASVLKQRDAWVFCAFYCVTFGGFVGLSNYLTIFFNTQYGLSAVHAADFATVCVIAEAFSSCRWFFIRSDWWFTYVNVLVCGGRDYARRHCVFTATYRGSCAAVRRHDVPWRWQRLCIPARAAALRQRNRAHDRHRRRCWWHRRVLSPSYTGSSIQINGFLYAGLHLSEPAYVLCLYPRHHNAIEMA